MTHLPSHPTPLFLVYARCAAPHVPRTAIQAPVHAMAVVVGARHGTGAPGVEDPRPVASLLVSMEESTQKITWLVVGW